MPLNGNVREGIKWYVWGILGVILAVITFTALYVTVLAPAGNKLDQASQNNQLQHLKRQSAIVNQQNQLTYGSLGYQDAQIQVMEQRISNITGPSGLALTRAGLSKNDPEQQVLQASEMSEIGYFCEAGVKVAPSNPQFTSGNPSLARLYAANCTAGTAQASPPLAQNPIPDEGA